MCGWVRPAAISISRRNRFGSEGSSEVGPEDLQGHLTVMPHIFSQIDRRHPAFAQLTLDGVAAFEGGVQASNGIGHGRTPGSDLVKIREWAGRRKQNPVRRL